MIRQVKKLSILGLLGISFSLISATDIQAQKVTRTPTAQHPANSTHTLTAGHVKPGFDKAAIDSMMIEIEMGMEDAEFPSDELYESWNTEYVKAYKGVEIPETYRIDVSDFVMPFEGKVTSPYGPRGRRMHYGTDFKLQVGDTIRAAFDGKVRVKRYERKGYGMYIVLRHSNGLETVYGHMSHFLVNQDQIVKAGEPIGLGGNTGRSTGSHLHFEFRFLGIPINTREILDLDEMAIRDDQYVFVKGKTDHSSSVGQSKYSSNSVDKIKYHRVRRGETLSAIARKHGTTAAKIAKLNNIKITTTLHVGKSLRIG
jgi:murein DD-endopeptidase MepM/ murein hydrolase activator NlpD